MQNNNQTTEQSPRKMSSKKIILIFFLVVILSFLVYGYFWVRSTQKIRLEAEGVVQDAKNYQTIREKIQTEKSRCENFISQKEGDFGSFEYCKRFIDWSDLN